MPTAAPAAGLQQPLNASGLLLQQQQLLTESAGLHLDPDDASSAQNVAKISSFLMEELYDCLVAIVHRQHSTHRLAESLSEPAMARQLRRMRVRGLLSSQHWLELFPAEKPAAAAAAADSFSLELLLLLVKHACRLAPPAAAGAAGAGSWCRQPDSADRSEAAAVLRLLQLQQELASLPSCSSVQTSRLFRRIAEQLQLLGRTVPLQQLQLRRHSRLPVAVVQQQLQRFSDWHEHEHSIVQLEAQLELRKAARHTEIPLLQRRLATRDPLPEVSNRKRRSVVAEAALAKANASERSRVQRWSRIRTGMVLQERRIIDRNFDRLVEEVKADSCIEHLASRGVVTQEEAAEVFSTLRNTEQMSSLIELLVPKSGNVFEEFLESFRSKNESLYQAVYLEYAAAKADILADKPQSLPYCHETLQQRYKTDFEQWNPIPWYANAATDIGEFYCNQQLLNLSGRTVSPFSIFEADGSEGSEPVTVVIEGDPGTGKSTLAKYMAYSWANDSAIFGREFQLLLLLDLKVTAPTVKVMLMEQLFGVESKLSDREIWEVVEANQEDSLLIIDGFEDNLNDEMRTLLLERPLPDLRILVLSQTNFTVRLPHCYQRKVIVTGFARGQAEEYVRKYVRLARKPWDLFTPFLSKLAVTKKVSDLHRMLESLSKPERQQQQQQKKDRSGSTESAMSTAESNLTRSYDGANNASSSPGQQPQQTTQAQQSKIASLRYYAQIPLYCSFFCLLTDMRMSIDLNSPTTIVEQFVSCVKLKLIERDKESRFEANRAYALLNEQAMDSMKHSSATFMLSDDDKMMAKFGLVLPAVNLLLEKSPRVVFANRLIQEYLAAKYLDSAGTDEASRFFQNMSMTPVSYNVVVFYCSIRKSDNDTAATRELFKKVVQFNSRRTKASRLRMQQQQQQLLLEQDDNDEPDSESLIEGKITDFQLSLECVAVMDSVRKEFARDIAKSLPERVIVKHEGIIPRLSLTGLSKMIRMNHDTIQEIDLRLDLLAKQSLEAYKSLAAATKVNSHVRTLRIFWTEKDMLADFLQTVCSTDTEQDAAGDSGQPVTELRRKATNLTKKLLKNLECIDESGRRSDPLTPKMLSGIRDACSSMSHLKRIAFRDCRHQGLVGCVIKNLPTRRAPDLELLDFSGCEVSIVASQELNSKLVESKSLRRLNLSCLHIDSMAFNAFIEAFSNNRTIVSLDLSGVRLDHVCFFSLSEALKINNKLEQLLLRRVTLDARACSELARVLKINKTLRVLEVTEEFIVEEGRRELGQEAKSANHPNRASVEGLAAAYKVRPTIASKS